MLMDGHVGLAYTFREQAKRGCSVFHGLRPLANRPASKLLTLLESRDPIEAGVGLACANALANRPAEGLLDGDVLDLLKLQSHERVGMIGYFGPLIKTLKQRVRSLTVFERIEEPQRDLRPIEGAETILPQCQVALITATAIINQTIDHLLLLSAHCRDVVILGASTPLLPSVFTECNVTLLAGVIVRQAEGALRVISEGGGMRQFSPYVRKCSRLTQSSSLVHALPVQGRRP
jgi:uncharacterized protein (DUF4213/DUF364 family)